MRPLVDEVRVVDVMDGVQHPDPSTSDGTDPAAQFVGFEMLEAEVDVHQIDRRFHQFARRSSHRDGALPADRSP